MEKLFIITICFIPLENIYNLFLDNILINRFKQKSIKKYIWL